MATFRNRSGKWQARVQIQGHSGLSKTFTNKADAERWAKQVEVEMQKGGAKMIQNPEKYLITAGGKIRCRRFKAQSSRTKLQCPKPALKGKAFCGHHGGSSTGPKTMEGKDHIRVAHLKHGDTTLEAKIERSEKSAMFRYLTDIGNHCSCYTINLRPEADSLQGKHS